MPASKPTAKVAAETTYTTKDVAMLGSVAGHSLVYAAEESRKTKKQYFCAKKQYSY